MRHVVKHCPHCEFLLQHDMPNYRRLYVPGGTYAFTVNLRDRKQTLLTDHHEQLLNICTDVQTRRPFTMPVWAILPDHLHCIWTLPEGDANFSTRWRLIKSGFSRSVPKSAESQSGRRPGERGIWQRRFWEHHIRDEDDLRAAINYIHTNPVKHGYVDHPADWPHSSWHGFKEYSETDLFKM